jgi:hypothetical protein
MAEVGVARCRVLCRLFALIVRLVLAAAQAVLHPRGPRGTVAVASSARRIGQSRTSGGLSELLVLTLESLLSTLPSS